MSKTTIEDYVNNFSREERTKHLDLTTPCQDALLKHNYGSLKKGDPVNSKATQMIHAMENLKDFLNLSGKTNKNIHTCHACPNNTNHGGKCVNEKHVYFGTSMENHLDKPSNQRDKIGRKAAIAAAKSPNSINNRYNTCPRCGKDGKGPSWLGGHINKGTKNCPLK